MCCLFGLMDTGRELSVYAKTKMIRVLSRCSQVRGTDATGIAYNDHRRLTVVKHPLPASRIRFQLPREATVIMGHTRMATQGAAACNRNNHPFLGCSGGVDFALAHNGVLWNDHKLRSAEKLPATRIETDSYVAVQLLERAAQLDFEALTALAVKVQGSFVFTVLDRDNNLYFVKGSNPLAILQYPGFLLYASTGEILQAAVKKLGLRGGVPVPVHTGEVVKITATGEVFRDAFPVFDLFEQYYSPSLFTPQEQTRASVTTLKEISGAFGVTPGEIQLLLDYGFHTDEVEELLYHPLMLEELLAQAKYDYAY